MSTENITAFQAKVAASAELQSRLAAIRQSAAAQVAESLAKLAAEVGTPFTVDELLATTPAEAELSDQDLATVAGGASSSTIIKKERAPNSILNLWGLWGQMHRYTTDAGKTFTGSTNYEVGQTYTPAPHFPAK